jgi:hypothetical protein
VFGIVRTSANGKTCINELTKLAEKQIAEAMQIEPGPERLRVLTLADVLNNLAAIKNLLLQCERRLLN